ncbi:MAG: HNH endonuclease, partial [Acidimicrobiia bacterium]
HHAHGGPTDTTNLALLCRHHHGIIHRHGWTMTPTTTPNNESHPGYFTITTTDGTQLPTQHHQPPPPPRPAPA